MNCTLWTRDVYKRQFQCSLLDTAGLGKSTNLVRLQMCIRDRYTDVRGVSPPMATRSTFSGSTTS